jgi:hypothetical protein
MAGFARRRVAFQGPCAVLSHLPKTNSAQPLSGLRRLFLFRRFWQRSAPLCGVFVSDDTSRADFPNARSFPGAPQFVEERDRNFMPFAELRNC